MTPPKPTCVVLFDIDGTLVTGAQGRTSAGVRAMSSASVASVGQPSAFAGGDYAGRTDIQIARMLLADAGVSLPSREQIDTLIHHYIETLSRWIEELPYRALGRPRPAVERLRRDGALVGLGTGNVRAGAFFKLESAGIADLFRPDQGGFGEDGETRTELLEKGARSLDRSRTLPLIVIGDTPHDIAGAHGVGGRCVGVPFGPNSREVLEGAGADGVVDRIDESLGEVVRTLLAGGSHVEAP